MRKLTNKVIKRELVCVLKGCDRGCAGEHTGKGCPYNMLHLMEDRGGVQKRPRRSGKTRELLSIANELVVSGKRVYYLTRTRDLIDSVTRAGVLNVKVVTMSIHEMRYSRARGCMPGLVVADELQPDEIAEAMRELVGSRLVAAYWSAW